MKLIEMKVIFDADNIKEVQKEIIEMMYEFGIQGVKIDEPLEKRNVLDFYKDERLFLMKEYSVSAYYPKNIYAEKKQKLIEDAFTERFIEREDVIYSLDFYEHDEEDYQNAWKKYLYPEKVSENFVVKPTWREYEADEDEMVIELDPGRAFGTGSHPTTSLCLKLMEENIKDEASVIDVGTGSGILMVAADKLNASEIWGVDIDDLAVESAKENLLLNNVNMDKVNLFKGDLVKVIDDKKFEVVVANILADVIVLLLEDMSRVIEKDGMMILSGIIDEKLDSVVKKVKSLGFEVIEVKQDKEWRAILAKA